MLCCLPYRELPLLEMEGNLPGVEGACWLAQRSPPFSEEAMLRGKIHDQIRDVDSCWVGNRREGGMEVRG